MSKSGRLILIAVTVVVVIFFGWYLNIHLLENDENRGTYGDMFGSINALYSGLALAGIIFTILLQKDELGLQREELKETRKEFQTQNRTLKIQRFENTFFNLLSLHHQIVDGIDFRKIREKNMWTLPHEEKDEDVNITLTGRDVFEHLYKKLHKDLNTPDIETIVMSYDKHYELTQADFGHYFRNLYRIVKLVNNTNFSFEYSKGSKEEEYKIKYQYTSILRAQLSDFELLWLFYNCLSYNGQQFKTLVEKYTLLKNIPFKHLASLDHKKFFEPTAFEKIKW